MHGINKNDEPSFSLRIAANVKPYILCSSNKKNKDAFVHNYVQEHYQWKTSMFNATLEEPRLG